MLVRAVDAIEKSTAPPSSPPSRPINSSDSSDSSTSVGNTSNHQTNALSQDPPQRNRDVEGDNDGFKRPSYHLRRERRKNKTIVGTSTNMSCSIRGAPQLCRDMFITRVDVGTSLEELTHFIEQHKIHVIKIVKVSHVKAKFSSFKVTVNVSDINSLLDANMWPSGIIVRRFYEKRE